MSYCLFVQAFQQQQKPQKTERFHQNENKKSYFYLNSFILLVSFKFVCVCLFVCDPFGKLLHLNVEQSNKAITSWQKRKIKCFAKISAKMQEKYLKVFCMDFIYSYT